MADRGRGPTPRCDERCGCPVPCPGGAGCRCTTSSAALGDEDVHRTCPCGEHCSCNPCTCAKNSDMAFIGRASCKCGPGCTCSTCTT